MQIKHATARGMGYDGPAKGLTRDILIDIYGPEFEDVATEGLIP